MQRLSVSRTSTPRPLRPQTSGAVIWAGALAVAVLGLTGLAGPAPASAQPRSEPLKSAVDTAQAAPGSASHPSSSKVASATKPQWSELTAEQQQALQPLAAHWHTLSTGHKRKWLALSRNYANMSADDRTTLHSRMIEWAALSNQQRAQARLNFAEVKSVPADERKAKWEQYQALSEEEKRRLAERAPTKPRGAAVPVRPVPAQKLVTVPAVTPTGQHTPRILLAPPVSAAASATPSTSPAAVMVATPPERVPGIVSVVPSPASGTSSPPVPPEAQVPMPSASPSGSAPSAAAGRPTEQSSPP